MMKIHARKQHGRHDNTGGFLFVCKESESSPCLPVVTGLAKGLPVFFIPEQTLIAPVRNDMIDHCCRFRFSFPQALCAERMQLKKSFPGLSPPSVVSSRVSTAAHMIRTESDVLLAVNLTGFTYARTSRESARPSGIPWHFSHLTSPASAGHEHHKCFRHSYSS